MEKPLFVIPTFRNLCRKAVILSCLQYIKKENKAIAENEILKRALTTLKPDPVFT